MVCVEEEFFVFFKLQIILNIVFLTILTIVIYHFCRC